MTAEYIYRCAQALKNVFKTSEAKVIFDMRGAVFKKTESSALMGMICVCDGVLTVFIREDIESYKSAIETARLLGHAVLHRERLLEGECFEHVEGCENETSAEREATLFAADLLIPDEIIKEMECFGFTEGQMACELGKLRCLAPYKLLSMRCRGEGTYAGGPIKSDVSVFIKKDI